MLAAPEPAGSQVQRAADRFVSHGPGLTSRHSFSFGEHYDPRNVAFGPLLAHNEDLVDVARGYDDHPHRDTEILTWVLSGSLQHTDSFGHTGLIYPRLAQRMSAGSGIVHAERNDGFTSRPDVTPEPAHFVQMWLRPDVPGGPPSYAQAEVAESALRADWVPVASDTHVDRAVGLGTAGATLWVTVVATGQRRVLPEAPRVHAFVARGQIDVETVGPLTAGDTLRLTGAAALAVTATQEAEVLVWALPPHVEPDI